jgi:hypothetical protein
MYSWAIQSNLKDPSKPCPPYHIQDKESRDPSDSFRIPTELIFGFGKKIVDSFPNVRQTVIAGHPPGSFIDQHVDTDKFVKIHIPIITNSNSYFSFGDENYNLSVGNAYMINTALMHGTDNRGETDRVHLIFKITEEDARTILNTEYVLDSKLIDFDVFELPNFKYDHTELLDYYKSIETNHQDMKWTLEPRDLSKNSKLYPSGYDDSVGIYGYAIQTNMKDSAACSPAYNVKTIDEELKLPYATNRTKLLYGFAQKLLDKLPYIEEMVITGHIPNSKIHMHIDNDINVRVHLPILVNNSSYFIYQDKYVLEQGKAYIVNTSIMHSTDNQGDTDRVHLLFKIPLGRVKELMSQTITI